MKTVALGDLESNGQGVDSAVVRGGTSRKGEDVLPEETSGVSPVRGSEGIVRGRGAHCSNKYKPEARDHRPSCSGS